MAFYSATLLGVKPLAVEIEIDLSDGLPFFQIVGLPDAILRESRTRVKSAIVQSGFEFPYDKRLVLNLAPSKIKKEGSGFELALAARILATSGQILEPPGRTLFLGELALDGKVRAVPEIEALAMVACQVPVDRIVVPQECGREIAAVLPAAPRASKTLSVIAVEHLNDLRNPTWFDNVCVAQGGHHGGRSSGGDSRSDDSESFKNLAFAEFWARLLIIASVGRHHILLCGPPGSGKTYFADGLRLLRQKLEQESNFSPEAHVLNSIFRRDRRELPWAAPHHSATEIGLVGGGLPPRPGAVTKAHGGILFLDELLEFRGAALDSLREPLEKGFIEICKGATSVTFPSRFQLVAATNPCKCGHWKSQLTPCQCSNFQRVHYQSRMSGPFFDRFDIRIFREVSPKVEKTVSGRQIFDAARRASHFKKKVREFSWSDEAQAYAQRCLETSNLRARRRVRSVAETMAALSLRSVVSAQDVSDAYDLQTLKDLS